MVPCNNPGCDAKLHPSARLCPQCGAITEKGARHTKTHPCKSCGAPLVIVEHVGKSYYSYIKDGTSYGGSSYDYNVQPCPNCGNPKPLKYFWIVYGPLLAFLPMAALFLFHVSNALFPRGLNHQMADNALENLLMNLIITPVGLALISFAIVFGYLLIRRIRFLWYC